MKRYLITYQDVGEPGIRFKALWTGESKEHAERRFMEDGVETGDPYWEIVKTELYRARDRRVWE